MKNPLTTIALFLIAFISLSATTLSAQDVIGTWQGTLDVGGGHSLRIVLKVSKGDDGKLNAVNYSIDQGGTPLPVSSISLAGSDLNFAVSVVGGKYEGKLSSDGNTITGTWSQGSPLPLNFSKATPATAWTIPEPPPKIPPMGADASPEFEVATIKPSKPEERGKGFQVRGREFNTFNTSLDDLITFAYGVHIKQVVGAPAWAETEKYDISGHPDIPGQPNDKQLKGMMKKLMEDRFQLKMHPDKKEMAAYTLVVAKGEPKLTKSQGDPNGLPGLGFRGPGLFSAANASMSEFCQVMEQVVLDRPVVDQTGLKGKYDFSLTWTADESQFVGSGIPIPPPSDKPDAPPGLFTAIQEQLGLKLDPAKTPVDVLVIDHVEKPSPN